MVIHNVCMYVYMYDVGLVVTEIMVGAVMVPSEESAEVELIMDVGILLIDSLDVVGEMSVIYELV